MKNAILLISGTFFISSCAMLRKTEKTTQIEKISDRNKETSRDSVSKTREVLPSDGSIVFDLSDLSKWEGDFMQKIKSGNNESTIEKKGGKLIVSNKNAGSKDSEIKVKESSKETIYNSEFVKTEVKKLIKSFPTWVWVVLIVALIVHYRKFIVEIIVAIFPALGMMRLFSTILGGKK